MYSMLLFRFHHVAIFWIQTDTQRRTVVTETHRTYKITNKSSTQRDVIYHPSLSLIMLAIIAAFLVIVVNSYDMWQADLYPICMSVSQYLLGIEDWEKLSSILIFNFFLNVSECWNECVILWMFLCLVCSTITMSVLPIVTCNAHSY